MCDTTAKSRTTTEQNNVVCHKNSSARNRIKISVVQGIYGLVNWKNELLKKSWKPPLNDVDIRTNDRLRK